ncbi:hypothetical protein [Halalkalicoccus jeotgali]|uniref:Uncharacterized protein n=1 Tax=Halalkalicoccus jeotgali (strain DSM 18796 / CECT 7217 / JCM 14584 / KCTC 4019 / B3) TaxID=795797 RepID=D8J3I7_HALJB|nr:hypothetical protein [Halalkalicoccus jeotgali]ADJ15294.1 hypothetical protein HacjB3_09555 [Halalkalicoccus jeotgali B3]ELY35493.1 hypothetical protein C497_13121 [Halalkalicoccus jeotgali B3]
MAVTDGHDIEPIDEHEEPAAFVSALRTSPDRIVFTEDGNSEGWIATDYTVSLTQ